MKTLGPQYTCYQPNIKAKILSFFTILFSKEALLTYKTISDIAIFFIIINQIVLSIENET